MIKDKPMFRVEKELLNLQPVKDFLIANDVEVDGLHCISRGIARIFYYKNIDGKKIMTSELIEF